MEYLTKQVIIGEMSSKMQVLVTLVRETVVSSIDSLDITSAKECNRKQNKPHCLFLSKHIN